MNTLLSTQRISLNVFLTNLSKNNSFLVETAAGDFVKFVRTFDMANCYMNTYTGEIGQKSESIDVESNTGLTVLHPYYSNITLLPFQ